jgi:dihydroorotase-like cyclic amidohydrolase
LTNQVILVKDGRIADVGPADRVQIPQGAKVIDLSRATVLPGLIDRHVHLMQDAQPNEARLVFIGLHYALKNLCAGFTTLQDMNLVAPRVFRRANIEQSFDHFGGEGLFKLWMLPWCPGTQPILFPHSSRLRQWPIQERFNSLFG